MMVLLSNVSNGIIRGMQKFGWQSAIGIVNVLLKLGIGVLLVSIGFGVAGALMALGINALAATILPFILFWFVFRYKKDKIESNDILSYSWPTLIASIALLFIVNLDMILVKHYFVPLEAGYYAAAGLLTKGIWFASGTLVFVMFPKIANNRALNKESAHLLRAVLLYTFIISLVAVIIYFMFPEFIVGLLFGKEYVIGSYLGIFGLGLGFYSLNNTIIMSSIAARKFNFLWFLVLCLVLEALGIVFFHSSLEQVVYSVVLSNVLLFVGMLFFTRKVLFYA